VKRLAAPLRALRIVRVLLRHRLDTLLDDTPLARFTWLLKPFVRARAEEAALPRGARLRLALQELGPIFVKFGQALSTRRDLLPADIADELEKLQDRVPPFPGAEARAIVERAYGRPVTEVFEQFDETPLAAASIAQVHTARLRSGEEVVVKVIRPGIRALIERDLEVMHQLALGN
jgi:ubiquinone biosynthesis protein